MKSSEKVIQVLSTNEIFITVSEKSSSIGGTFISNPKPQALSSYISQLEEEQETLLNNIDRDTKRLTQVGLELTEANAIAQANIKV